MSQRPSVDPITAVVAEAPPVAVSVTKPAAALHLGGDEIIQLSVRPSPWCIGVCSGKLVIAMLLIAGAIALASRGQPSLAASGGLVVCATFAFGGVLVSTLHWASQLYVLTNRRVLRFRGVFNVDVAECALVQIGEARLTRAWYEPMLRLGSIHMTPTNPDKPALIWEHVARPAEVHEILVRAIQKSKTGP